LGDAHVAETKPTPERTFKRRTIRRPDNIKKGVGGCWSSLRVRGNRQHSQKEASAQAKREAAEKVEAEREAAERAEREAAEQVIREVGEPAKSEVTAKPESGISDGPSFTDGIRRK
jgi:hypothetical protein